MAAVERMAGAEAFADQAWIEAPAELQEAIKEFWPAEQWHAAAAVAKLESAFDAFAVDHTLDESHRGAFIGLVRGVRTYAERSVGYFQINSCNFPDLEWQRLYNARHNSGTAHMLWDRAGQSWSPWYFSATRLGLI